MATKIKVAKRGGSGSDGYDLSAGVAEVTKAVNAALKDEKKFVTFKLADGKQRSIIAEKVIAISED